jgi:putative alpha-1,2-mannosidase
MREYLLFIILCLTGVFSCTRENRDPAKYVNPMIGASTNTTIARALHGMGKTVPGATTPFGSVQVSPNTITGGDNGSGYSDEHQTIEGFAFTQIGTGAHGDLGNFLVMPTNGTLYLTAGKENDTDIKGWRSRYDKQSEQAGAG